MITVGDNFNYQGRKPLDSRFQFVSLADMKAYPDASLYDGCIAYVTANKKNYQYDSNNTVDTTTGKWREFTAGGGGGGSVPAGGTTGQALLKASNADEDVTWGNVVDAKAFHTDEQISDIVDDVSYFPYMYTVGQSFYKYRMSWGNVKSKLKTYFDQYYSGGGSGTSNYNDLTNKPQIAGNTLTGNTSLATLGLTSSVETQYGGSSTKSYVSRGEKYDWNTGNTVYGTCSTSASTTNKSVIISRGTFNFTAGARIAVRFSYNNTASAPTLTVSSTTKNIKCIDETGSTYTPVIWWDANDIVEFVYDGTQFLMQPTTGMMFKIHGTTIPRESIYSTSEKVVGCWTDGRPVYQKTFSIVVPEGSSGPTSTKTNEYNIGASVREIVELKGVFKISSGAYLPFERTTLNATTATWITANTHSHTLYPDAVLIQTNTTQYAGCTGSVTVQYTKTTDSANSFNYADPNDYSTTEKIVGTWIDGSTLYQKTINTGALPANTVKTVAHNISNLKYAISCVGWFGDSGTLQTSGTLNAPMPYGGNKTQDNSIEVWVDKTYINIKDSVDYSSRFTTSYVTIQYTKS